MIIKQDLSERVSLLNVANRICEISHWQCQCQCHSFYHLLSLMDIIKLLILLISISFSLIWAKSSEASKSEEDGNVEVLPGEFKLFSNLLCLLLKF